MKVRCIKNHIGLTMYKEYEVFDSTNIGFIIDDDGTERCVYTRNNKVLRYWFEPVTSKPTEEQVNEKKLLLSGLESFRKKSFKELSFEELERYLTLVGCLLDLNWKEVGSREGEKCGE